MVVVVVMGGRAGWMLAWESSASTSSQKSLERAEATSYRPHTLLSLERILRWQPRSIAAVLAGGDPTPMPDDYQVEPLTVIEHLVQLRTEVGELRQAVAALAAEPELAAFKRGHLARSAGQEIDSCPFGHEQQALRKAWTRGWLDETATEPTPGHG